MCLALSIGYEVKNVNQAKPRGEYMYLRRAKQARLPLKVGIFVIIIKVLM